MRSISADLSIAHVEIYTPSIRAAAKELRQFYGFRAAPPPAHTHDPETSLALANGSVRLLLTDGPPDAVGEYLNAHGAGVVNIALATSDVAAVVRRARANGAEPLDEPVVDRSGTIVAASFAAFGDVSHTFVRRPRDTVVRTEPDRQLRDLDHIAVCVRHGELAPTVEFYRRCFDFDTTFQERITVGPQAMDSMVVQSRSGRVTLTILEPDPSAEPGQIDDFLKNHGGSGVQHLAFSTADIVRAVGSATDRGVGFLSTPSAYYDSLHERVTLNRHHLPDLRRLNILVDEDHYGTLYQIFARSTHPRRTLFFELIERAGARTFGSRNIRALYEAIEQEWIRGQEASS
jgi:4-hydroxymandelate synthase